MCEGDVGGTRMTLSPSLDVWWWEVDLAVKAARPEEGRVQDVWTVCTCQDHHISGRHESWMDRKQHLPRGPV